MSVVEETASDAGSTGDLPRSWDPYVEQSLAASLRGYGVRFSQGVVCELLEAIAYKTNLNHTNMYMLDAAHVSTYMKSLGPVGVKTMIEQILTTAAPNTPWLEGGLARSSRARTGREARSPPRSPCFKELFKVAPKPSDAPILVNPVLTFVEGCEASLKVEKEGAQTTASAPSIGIPEMAAAVAQALATNGILSGSGAGGDADDGMKPRQRRDRLPQADARKWRDGLYKGAKPLVPIELAEERPSDSAMELSARNLGYGAQDELPMMPYYETKPYTGTPHLGWDHTRAILHVRCTDSVSDTLSGRVV